MSPLTIDKILHFKVDASDTGIRLDIVYELSVYTLLAASNVV